LATLLADWREPSNSKGGQIYATGTINACTASLSGVRHLLQIVIMAFLPHFESFDTHALGRQIGDAGQRYRRLLADNPGNQPP
jgi:hypothetical protein